MNKHEVKVENVILHILDTNLGTPVLSHKEIGPDQEGFDFIENLVHKMLADDNGKNAVFSLENNRIKELCQSLLRKEIDFVNVSRELAGIFYDTIAHYPEIPPADLACFRVLIDNTPYLGCFKLNYRTNYIHHVQNDSGINVNLLVKQKTVLPGENQRVEEGFLVNFNDLGLRLVEKEFEIDGEKQFYLSKKILGCGDQLSTAEKAKIINKVAEKIGKKYQNEKYDVVARLRKVVAEEMEEGKNVNVGKVAREIFKDDPSAQREYIEEVQQAGIEEAEVQLSEKITERKFRNHKIKTDTGIEINFPATYYTNKEMIEFINNPNGTVSILIKNVAKISSK